MWINPENIILSKINQIQKDKYGVIPLTWNYLEQANSETEIRLEATRAEGLSA